MAPANGVELSCTQRDLVEFDVHYLTSLDTLRFTNDEIPIQLGSLENIEL